jgi:DNA-binding NtrC family response regulator
VTKRVLIVEDDSGVAAALEMLLENHGWEVKHAETARHAYVEFAAFSPDLVLLDIELPDASGLDVLQQLKNYSEQTPVIMVSGVGTLDAVVRSMQLGAETFLPKPFGTDALTVALEQVAKAIATRRELEATKRAGTPEAPERLPGISPVTVEVNALIERVAAASSPVLLEGESGSGKGVIARLIHRLSPRAKAPFVDLNCAGLSKELLESELFGHERGAFTSATTTKQGLFEVAANGTLFLDEIGEMEPSIQARLLKAIEDRKFRRVGGVRDLQADFRLIAATNRVLKDEVAAGRFRKDLYYRLNVVTLRVPALRERADDIPILVHELTSKLAVEMGRRVPPKVSDRALRKLAEYPWPGNVRELRNVLERAMLTSTDDEVRVEDLHLDNGQDATLGTPVNLYPSRVVDVRPLDEVTTNYIRATLNAVNGNSRKAARLLDISPTTLYARLREERD